MNYLEFVFSDVRMFFSFVFICVQFMLCGMIIYMYMVLFKYVMFDL